MLDLESQGGAAGQVAEVFEASKPIKNYLSGFIQDLEVYF